MREQMVARCDHIEEAYEFMLAYAAQGLASDAGSNAGSQVRHFLSRLDAASVPCSRVNSAKDIFADEHMRARDNVISVPALDGQALAMPGIVPKLSRTPGRVDAAGPAAIGAHNEEIYCGRLGLSRDDLAALRKKGIV